MKMPDTYKISFVLFGVSAFLCFVVSSSQATSCDVTLPNLSCSNETEYISCRCLSGYEPTGSTSVAVCLESGDGWVGDLNCTAIQCTEPPIPAGCNLNATRGTMFDIGNVISYTCESGYEAEGQPLRTCQENGTWTESDFYCNATCPTGSSLRYQNDVCFELSTVSLDWANSKIACEGQNSTLAKIGNSGQQTFLQEHIKSMISTDRYWIGGKESKAWIWEHSGNDITFFPWAPFEPNDDLSNENCIQLSDLLSSPADGSLRHNYRWNDVNCGDRETTGGYQHSALCQFEMPCPIDSVVADQQVNYSSRCLAFKRGYFDWSAAKDYCTGNGGWLVEVTDQEMQDFLMSYLSDTEKFPNNLTNWWTGAVVDSSVTDRVWRWTDYELITAPSWSPNEPSNPDEKCIEMINPNYTWNDERCDSGYLKYICQTDLYFDSCGYPGAPVHGQLFGTEDGDFNIDDQVEFGCDDGYKLEGSSTRTCLSNGKWSGEETTCKIVSCDDPPEPPQNGNVTVLSKEYRGVAILSCADGYLLQGEAVTVCSSKATWGVLNSSCLYDALEGSTTQMMATGTVTVMEKTTVTITSVATQPTVTSSTSKLETTVDPVTTKSTNTAASVTTQPIMTVTSSTAKLETTVDPVTTKPTNTAASGATKLSTPTTTMVKSEVPSKTTSREDRTTDTLTTPDKNKGDESASETGLNGTIIAIACFGVLILLVLLIVICCWCRSCRLKERHFERVHANGNKPVLSDQGEIHNQAFEPSAVSNDYEDTEYSAIGNSYQSVAPYNRLAFGRMTSQERPLVDEIELGNSYDVLDRGNNYLPGKGELFVVPKITDSEQFSYARVELNRGASIMSTTADQA